MERGEDDVPYLSFEQAHASREAMEPGRNFEQQVIVLAEMRVNPCRIGRRSTTAAFCVVRPHVLNTHVLGRFLLGVLLFFSSRRSGRCTRRKDETGWCCRAATAAPIPRARPCKQL